MSGDTEIPGRHRSRHFGKAAVELAEVNLEEEEEKQEEEGQVQQRLVMECRQGKEEEKRWIQQKEIFGWVEKKGEREH